MNTVQLIGYIATDIKLRITKTEKKVASFNLAVKYLKETTFLTVNCWDSVAVNVAQYCQKGSRIAVVGSLKQENWEDSSQQKHQRVVVVARSIDFLTPKNNDNDETEPDQLVELMENAQ